MRKTSHRTLSSCFSLFSFKSEEELIHLDLKEILQGVNYNLL